MKDNKEISLFINTASKALQVGALYDNKIEIENIPNPKNTLELTNIAIENLGKKLSFSLRDVDNFYCLLGPGSNTGIRLGLTIPRTIYAINPKIKIYGLMSLKLFSFEGSYAALSDRNGNLFFYEKKNEDGSFIRIDKDKVKTINKDYKIVVEEKDELAISELIDNQLIKIDVLKTMIKHKDKFEDYSDKEEEYLPIYTMQL